MSKASSPPVPPYRAVKNHDVFPSVSHDEAARFDFLTHFNKFLASSLGRGNKLAYERRVLPAFRKEKARDPKDRFEIRNAMNRDPFHTCGRRPSAIRWKCASRTAARSCCASSTISMRGRMP